MVFLLILRAVVQLVAHAVVVFEELLAALPPDNRAVLIVEPLVQLTRSALVMYQNLLDSESPGPDSDNDSDISDEPVSNK